MKPDAEKTHETIEEFASDPGAAPEAAFNGQQSPLGAQQAALGDAQRPELYVGAALLGGLVLAQVLKKFGGDR